MNYKKLGNTDLVVSTICLGTMTWGEQNTIKEGFEQMDYALDQDINFFDAAEMYPSPCRKETYGETEKIIGHWFSERKNRDKIILASKISGPGMSYIRGGGLQFSEKNISLAIENSLKRLKTDYIDLYQLHWPERKTNFFGRLGYEHKEDSNEWNDFEFNNSEEWYQSIPKNVRPRKDQPFYHLLAENDDVTYEAYVSQQNLLVDDSNEPIKHPLINEIFSGKKGSSYFKPSN